MSQKKTITLDMLRAASTREQQRDLTAAPVLRLAALLNTWTFDRIAQLLRSGWGVEFGKPDRELLTEHGILLDEQGVYTLSDRTRAEVLGRAISEGWLPQWLRGRELAAADATEELLWAYLDDRRPRPAALPEQSMEELVAHHRVIGWLTTLSPEVTGKLATEWPAAAEVFAYIKREELLTPFRNMTRLFRGRETELARLREYVWGKDGPASLNFRSLRAPLLISGIGGVGKSTLIARFILDQAQADREHRIPCVYLDFDKSGYSISEPLTLASEALRQLALQFPTRTVGEGERAIRVADIMQDIRSDIRTTLGEGGGRPGRSKYRKEPPAYQSQQTTISIRGNLYESISRQYLPRFEKELQSFSVPLLVVLDSFEEAQYRASASEILNLFRFIDEVAEFFPQLRLFIVGRNDLELLGRQIQHLELGPFDEPAALAYLRAAGLEDPDFARELYQEVGGNPLTLKLAARYIREERERRPGHAFSVHELLEDIDAHRVQEQLVRRNLKHIKDHQVRQLAFPGMLVRRISPAIIREVLAKPCGLGEISVEVAEYIYRNLQREQFLLGSEEGQLVFRRDLRTTLYDLVVKEYGATAEEIHQRAMAYYRERRDPASRAEYLYHWLMTGGDLDVLKQENLSKLRPYLENYLPELPLNAYIYLAAQLGIRVRPDFIRRARLREWEDYLVAETEDVLRHGEVGDLAPLAERWAERAKRTGRPEIRYAEAKLAARRTEAHTDPEDLLRFQTADPHLGIHNLYCRQLEYQRAFERCFAELEKIDPARFSAAEKRDQLHYLLQYFRVACRIKRPSSVFARRFSGLLSQKSFGEEAFIEYVPLYYAALSGLIGKTERDLLEAAVPQRILQFLDRTIRPALLSAPDYTRLYEEIAALPDPLSALDQQLNTRMRQTVFTLTETGTQLVDISEVIYFLELRYGGDVERIRQDILGVRGTETTGQVRSEVGELVEQTRTLISNARSEQAIELLQKNLHLLGDYEKELYLVASRFKRMQQEDRMGTVSSEESSREFNRINFTLLEILDQIQRR